MLLFTGVDIIFKFLLHSLLIALKLLVSCDYNLFIYFCWWSDVLVPAGIPRYIHSQFELGKGVEHWYSFLQQASGGRKKHDH